MSAADRLKFQIAVFDEDGGFCGDDDAAQAMRDAVAEIAALSNALADVVAAEMAISHADFIGNRHQQLAAVATMNVALERARDLLDSIRATA